MNHATASKPAVSVTRKLEFDAGHRIPDHRSQCRNLHGHRYVLEVTLAGDIVNSPGASDNGMRSATTGWILSLRSRPSNPSKSCRNHSALRGPPPTSGARPKLMGTH